MKNLRQLIGEAIGQASTCWTNLSGAGEFDSSAAIKIIQQLENDIHQYIKEETIQTEIRMKCPVPALPFTRYQPVFPCYIWKVQTRPSGLPSMWLHLPTFEAARPSLKDCTHWLPDDSDPTIGLVLD